MGCRQVENGSHDATFSLLPARFSGMTGGDSSVMCAWCTGPARNPGQGVSVGICPECALGFIRKLPVEYLARMADPDGTLTLVPGYTLRVNELART